MNVHSRKMFELDAWCEGYLSKLDLKSDSRVILRIKQMSCMVLGSFAWAQSRQSEILPGTRFANTMHFFGMLCEELSIVRTD